MARSSGGALCGRRKDWMDEMIARRKNAVQHYYREDTGLY